jgi:hypothetical protein
MRAVLDTGCTAGNWVSLDTLDDLGIKQYLPLTEIEDIGAQAAGGAVVKACGAVNLTWRGFGEFLADKFATAPGTSRCAS